MQYEKDDTILTAEHITHFTSKTLIKLLSICGFSFIDRRKKYF